MGAEQGKPPPTPSGEERQRRLRLGIAGKAIEFGTSVAIVFGVFVWGGVWLDRRLDKSPLFLLLGLLIAFIAAGYSFYELVAFSARMRPPGGRAAGAAARARKKSWDEWDAEERAERDADER